MGDMVAMQADAASEAMADLGDCCNDAATAALTGKLCKTGQECQAPTGWMAPFALVLMALGGALFWAQISHGGRQTQKLVNPHPKSSSDVQLALPGGQFARPTPLTREEIAVIGVLAGEDQGVLRLACGAPGHAHAGAGHGAPAGQSPPGAAG